MKKTVITVLVLYLGIAAFLYVTQELFIFPVLLSQILNPSKQAYANEIPLEEIQEFFAHTSDGKDINVRTTFKDGDRPKNVALIFHGNAETVLKGNFLPFFKKLGIPAFTFDYRGYGKSSGWPSEQGLYLDSEAVWAEIHKRTGIEASHLILLGNSIGTGPASHLALELTPQILILLAAYSDFPTLISGMPLYAPFRFILRYNLPVANNIKDLQSKCIILAHGKKDEVIPFSHLGTIVSNINPNASLKVLESEDAGHNDIFYKVEDRLKDAVQACL